MQRLRWVAIAANVLGLVAVSPFLIREVPRGGGNAVLGLLFVATVALNAVVIWRHKSSTRATAVLRVVTIMQDAAWTLGMIIAFASALLGTVQATPAGVTLISVFTIVILVSGAVIAGDLMRSRTLTARRDLSRP